MTEQSSRDKLVATGWHWEFGWMRRSCLDDANGYCYEEPDGNLVFTPHLRHRKAMRLNCWLDSVTDEHYLSISHAPCQSHRFAK